MLSVGIEPTTMPTSVDGVNHSTTSANLLYLMLIFRTLITNLTVYTVIRFVLVKLYSSVGHSKMCRICKHMRVYVWLETVNFYRRHKAFEIVCTYRSAVSVCITVLCLSSSDIVFLFLPKNMATTMFMYYISRGYRGRSGFIKIKTKTKVS